MSRVLILTAGFGDGHNSAANHVRLALERIAPDTTVEVVDLLALAIGSRIGSVRRTHLRLVNQFPTVWRGLYRLFENKRWVDRGFGEFKRLRGLLCKRLQQFSPDIVVSTFPLYGMIVDKLFGSEQPRPFTFHTIITDSISINAMWYKNSSDAFFVAEEKTRAILKVKGVDHSKILTFGFPVHPRGCDNDRLLPPLRLGNNDRWTILFILNNGKTRSTETLDALLALESTCLTVVTGRQDTAKRKLESRYGIHHPRIRIMGWTDRMPELMASHHLVISKAGGATVHECLAAARPMIINQVIPGQEEGNAQLIQDWHAGTLATTPRSIAAMAQKAFDHDGDLLRRWHENALRHGKPSAAIDIAKFILDTSDSRTAFCPIGIAERFHGIGDGSSVGGASQGLLEVFQR